MPDERRAEVKPADVDWCGDHVIPVNSQYAAIEDC